jgi:hypothetical protein
VLNGKRCVNESKDEKDNDNDKDKYKGGGRGEDNRVVRTHMYSLLCSYITVLLYSCSPLFYFALP